MHNYNTFAQTNDCIKTRLYISEKIPGADALVRLGYTQRQGLRGILLPNWGAIFCPFLKTPIAVEKNYEVNNLNKDAG